MATDLAQATRTDQCADGTVKARRLVLLDLGPGKSKRGNIGLDLRPGAGVDVVCDLDRGIPVRDDSCDAVFAFHFLEHVRDPFAMLTEIHRVTKPEGTITLVVPHFSNPYAHEVFHRTSWNSFSLDVLFAEGNSLQSRPMFRLLRREIRLFPTLGRIRGLAERYVRRHLMLYELYLHRALPAYEILFEMQPMKREGDRHDDDEG